MRRQHVWTAAVLFVAASCSTPPSLRVVREPGGPVLQWPACAPGPDATDVRYEVAIHDSDRGLPRRRVVLAKGLATPRYAPTGLPRGEYLWSVRARYQRGGLEWVTRWATDPVTGGAWAIEPQRGFAVLTIR